MLEAGGFPAPESLPGTITLSCRVLDHAVHKRYIAAVTDLARSRASRTNVVEIDTHAQATLRYIRSSMDAAALVATPGSAGIAIGLVGVIAALLAAGPGHAHWLTVWISAAPLASLMGAAIMARQQRLQGRTLFGPSVRRFVLCLAPALLVGAALTTVDLYDGNLRVIPGTWLLLYGCAVMAASAMTIGLVAWLGGLFVLLGIAALLLPASAHNLILGVGFGGLHLLFGAYLIGRSSHER